MQDHLFGHHLDRGRQIHILLGDRSFGFARWAAEEILEAAIRHGEAGAIVEIRLIDPEASIRFQVQQLVADKRGIFRLAVGRQPHQLVFTRIDLEAGVVGESRIEQAQRVGKMNLADDGKVLAAAERRRCRGPFAHAIHRQDQRLLEGRRIESAGGMAQVMLGKQEALRPIHVAGKPLQFFDQQGALEQFLAQPERHRHAKRREPLGGEAEIGLQQPLEFQERLVVKGNAVDIGAADPTRRQTIGDGFAGKAGVVLLAGEALLLRCCDHAAVLDQCRRAVVIVGGNAENAHRGHELEKRVDEGRHRRTLAEDHERAEQGEQDQDRQQPEFFPCPQEGPKLYQKCHAVFLVRTPD